MKRLLTFLFTVQLFVLHAQTIHYVKTGGTGNGTSWANASGDLQSMINNSGTGDAVWVARGTYKPSGNGDQAASFVMKNGVVIYGGFAGTEGQLSQRDWKNNPTILSGDLGNNDVITGSGSTLSFNDFNYDNSYHVIYNNNNGLNNTAVLDGFTITGGYANEGAYASGGGMYNFSASPTINNCSFYGNGANSYGGAVYNYNNSPSISNCSFYKNLVPDHGGAMENDWAAPTITNCSFFGNFSNSGGGLYNYHSSPSITNCSLSGNTANEGFGGGLYNYISSPAIINTIIWGNTARAYGGIIDDNSNSNISYSLVQALNPSGTGNLDGTVAANNPAYADAANGNLHLQPCSPVINIGNNNANNTATDLDAAPRKTGTIDMGAYEYQGAPSVPLVWVLDADSDGYYIGNQITQCASPGPGYVLLTTQQTGDCNDNNRTIYPGAQQGIVYVNILATGANNGSSWTNAYTSLQTAFANISCAASVQIWVAAGTYKPSSNGDPNAYFAMKNGVAIYGGFTGTESQLSQRNWGTNITILSGDLNGDDIISGSGSTLSISNNGENSHHVIYNNFALNSTAVLDGFTITGGYANDGVNAYGGGIFNLNASPTISNCNFVGNYAPFYGGGMYNYSCSPAITNCSFSRNFATSGGGGMLNISASPTVTNCSLAGNASSNYGGGMFNSSSSPNITNCIIWGNSSPNNAGLYISGGSPIIAYSLVQDMNSSGTGNLDGTVASNNPLLADIANGNLRLQPCSPVINAGNPNTSIATVGTIDLDHYARIVGGVIDMGAYEFQSAVPTTPVIISQPLAVQSVCQNSLATVLTIGVNGTGFTFQWFSNTSNNNSGGIAISNATGNSYTPPTGVPDTQYYYVEVRNNTCGTKATSNTATVTVNAIHTWYLDADNDGYYTGSGFASCTSPGAGYKYTGLSGGNDCNDNNAGVHAAVTYYRDFDNDGYGDPNKDTILCSTTAPAGYVSNNLDCDDRYATLNPAAVWVWDQDRDGYYIGTPDTACIPGKGYWVPLTTQQPGDCDDNDPKINAGKVWYLDADNDGYYVSSEVSCVSPGPGYNTTATVEGDCDDKNPTEWQSAMLYVDADGDGYTVGSATSVCYGATIPAGYTATSLGSDCDDNDSAKWQSALLYVDADGDGYTVGSATSVCYGATIPAGYTATSLGSDCDDNDSAKWQSALLYVDADGDGYTVGSATSVCYGATIPAGYTATSLGSDCDDNDSAKWQSALLYVDADGDGYTVGSATSVCYGATIPAGYTATSQGSDCNDADASIHTAQTWYLDADNDGHYISSQVSCGSPGRGYNTTAAIAGDCNDNDNTKWQSAMLYIDADGDGYTVGSPVSVCYGATVPKGYVLTSPGTDCDDNNPNIHAPQTWYRDADRDGYGNPAISIQSCSQPSGYVADNTDCNDSKANVYPKTWYADADGDGYGNPTVSKIACTQPAGYVANNSDCNDTNAAINPSTKWYKDADNDGYYTGSAVTSCASPGTGYKYAGLSGANDCNDTDNTVYPTAPELCDGKDNNCNGAIDEGCGTVTVSINDTSMNEGNKGKTSMTFTVTLSAASTKKVTVKFATSNGTATSGTDYDAKSGTVTFNPGITKQTISISIIGDKTNEQNETFQVNLGAPVNATIAKGTGTGTIVNDDGAAIASIVSSVNITGMRSVKISPTPANSILRIELSGYTGNVTLQLISMQGKTLLQKKMQAVTNFAKEEISVSGFASGAYLLAVIDDKGNMKTGKVIISH